MKKPRLVLSDAAVADVLEQADWYRTQSGPQLARRWELAITSAIEDALSHPAAGTRCKFGAKELRGVRRIAIPDFPRHLLFYRVAAGEFLVLRIVHGARDLEGLFS